MARRPAKKKAKPKVKAPRAKAAPGKKARGKKKPMKKKAAGLSARPPPPPPEAFDDPTEEVADRDIVAVIEEHNVLDQLTEHPG